MNFLKKSLHRQQKGQQLYDDQIFGTIHFFYQKNYSNQLTPINNLIE